MISNPSSTPSPIGEINRTKEQITNEGTATIIIRLGAGKEKTLNRFEVPAGQTIQEALGSLRLALSQPPVGVVNGATADMSYLLKPGDVVDLLPQIAGG
jgi:molybdopterin converting factor small subunit